MRILRVIHSVNPIGGGPVEGLKQLSAVLASQGHRVEVASLDDPHAPGVAEFPLPLHPLGPSRGSYGYTPKLVPWLRERAAEFDAVVVHGVWQFASFGVWRALHDGATPFFVYPHGMLDPWFKRRYPFKHLKKSLYWPWAEYRVLRHARAVLFTSDSERELARESFWPYRCHERVVSYGTAAPNGDATAQHAQREKFLGEFPNLRGKRLMLFLGRIHEKKGVDMLLRAFAEIPVAPYVDWHLVIAGPADATLRATLQTLTERLGIAARVTWTGLLQGERKWGALRAADAFVLPSHQENFGIAVAEALACGVPVLISDQVNIWREIESDAAGLIEPDTDAGVTALLRRWCALAESERTQMRERARACFERRYEINRVAAHFVQTLRESGVAA